MSEKLKRYGVSGWYNLAVSAVNGAFGDFLADADNGLGIQAGFYRRGKKVDIGVSTFDTPDDGPIKLVVLLHGLGCNERVWEFPHNIDEDYGSLLARDLGAQPFYMRYNTGLPIPVNGELVAQQLDLLVRSCPRPVESLTLIGHSMGGLVSRSAYTYSIENGHAWTIRCKRIITLGTPHMGAPLEKFAHLSAALLRKMPSEITYAAADVVDARSQGVKDLRTGTVHQVDPEKALIAQPPSMPDFYVVAGTLTNDENDWISHALGDGLVRVDSALGKIDTPDGVFEVPDGHCVIEAGLAHNTLAHHPVVYRHIARFHGLTDNKAAESGEESSNPANPSGDNNE